MIYRNLNFNRLWLCNKGSIPVEVNHHHFFISHHYTAEVAPNHAHHPADQLSRPLSSGVCLIFGVLSK